MVLRESLSRGILKCVLRVQRVVYSVCADILSRAVLYLYQYILISLKGISHNHTPRSYKHVTPFRIFLLLV